MPASPFAKGGVSVVKLDREDNRPEPTISGEEKERLIAAAPPHLRALIIPALDTDVRAGEMLAIRVKDANLYSGEITLRAPTTKSGKTRAVPISTQRLRAVIEWPARLIVNRFGNKIGSFRTTGETTILGVYGPRRPRASPRATGRRTV